MTTPIFASCQLPDVGDDLAGAVALVREAVDRVAMLGADAVCLPEGYLGGYTGDARLARARAIDLESRQFGAILEDLRSCRPTVIAGVIEHAEQATLNTAAIIRSGELIGVYRKRHPLEPAFTPGVELPIFEIGGVRVGVGICSDARNEDDAEHYAAQNVDALLYPLNNMLPTDTADRWRHQHLQILRERARQTSAWVLSADVVGTRCGETAYGCTVAIAPDGTLRDRVPESRPGTIAVSLQRAPT